MATAERVSGERPGRLVTFELGIAGALMILAGVSVLAMAFAGNAGGSIAASAQGIVALALGGVLVASGIEIVRRRHLLFAVVVTSVLALLSLGYAVASGEAYALATVAMFAAVVVLVVGCRRLFED
jgi:hypothetical protein